MRRREFLLSTVALAFVGFDALAKEPRVIQRVALVKGCL